MTKDELAIKFRGKVAKLKDIAAAYGMKVSGNKGDIIDRVLMGPVEYNDDCTIMDEIIKCFFF